MRLVGIAILILGAILLIANHDAGSVLGLRNEDFAQMLMLGALALVLATGVLARGRLAASVRGAVLWLGVVLALMLGYQSRYELQDFAHRVTAGLVPASPLLAADQPGRATVMVERGMYGHFETAAKVDGAQVRFLVDTGASGTVLTVDDARRAGIDVGALSYTIPVSTANGIGRAAAARIGEIAIGPIVRRNQPVLVAAEGQLGQSLLGMSFINSLSGFDMRGDRLILRE